MAVVDANRTLSDGDGFQVAKVVNVYRRVNHWGTNIAMENHHF